MPVTSTGERKVRVRVLHIRNPCGFYGPEKCIVHWISALAGSTFDFDVAVYQHPAPSMRRFVEAVRATGARELLLPRRHAEIAGVAAMLVKFVRQRQIDIIHSHDNRSQGLGWLISRLTGVPVVGTMHGYIANSAMERLSNRLNRVFLARGLVDVLTVPSRALQAAIPGAILLPNALPAAEAEGVLAADCPPHPPRFGVVARISPEKGLRVFLDSLTQLPMSWRFEVLGEGPLQPSLLRHSESHRVEWKGFRWDAHRIMLGWTAIVIPSLSEGLPLTLLEAMARGVPILATRVGGIPDMITDGREGFLVPAGQPGLLAERMRTIAGGSEAAQARARLARERFLRHGTLERVGNSLADLYRGVAEQ